MSLFNVFPVHLRWIILSLGLYAFFNQFKTGWSSSVDHVIMCFLFFFSNSAGLSDLFTVEIVQQNAPRLYC